jgi:hypothetical protein
MIEIESPIYLTVYSARAITAKVEIGLIDLIDRAIRITRDQLAIGVVR